MMWTHGMGWHWLGTLAIVLFWVLIIVLALAPIKYLRAELHSAELLPAQRDSDAQEEAQSSRKRAS